MNDFEAERLAHAVSNSDDLCLPSNPLQTLRDMEGRLRVAPPKETYTTEGLGYTRVNLRGYKIGQDNRPIDGKRLKTARNQRIIDLHKTAVPKAIIADMMGISVERVTQIIRRGY